ncbi:MAG: hypothetical protein ACOYLB_14715, partial [Phototrophicaceae bacterium]
MASLIQASRRQVYWVLAIGSIAISMGAIFARIAQNEAVPSLLISASRLCLATLAVSPWVIVKHRQELRTLTRRQQGLAL